MEYNEDLFDQSTVEYLVNNSKDFACIDAAAKAWIEAGGDSTGVEITWRYIRDRVEELS